MTTGVTYLARMSRLASQADAASRAARGEPATLRPSRPPFRDYGYPSPGMEGTADLAGSMGLPPGHDPGVPDGPVSAARGGAVRRQAAGSLESGAVPEALGVREPRSGAADMARGADWTKGGTDLSQGAVSRLAEAGLARGAAYAAGNGWGAGGDLGSGGAWDGPGAGDGLSAGGPGADGGLGAGSGLGARGTGSAVGAEGWPDAGGSRGSGPAAAGSTAAAAVSRTGDGNGWGSQLSDAGWASLAQGPSGWRGGPGPPPDWAVSATSGPSSQGSRSSQPDAAHPGVSIGTIEVTVLPPAPSPPDPGPAEPPPALLAPDSAAGAGGSGGLRAGLRRWHGIAQG